NLENPPENGSMNAVDGVPRSMSRKAIDCPEGDQIGGEWHTGHSNCVGTASGRSDVPDGSVRCKRLSVPTKTIGEASTSALRRARWSAGNRIATKIEMIEMTTSSSTRVNAR